MAPSNEEDGGPEQFARQRPLRKLVNDWLRETMGSVEADNVGKKQFHALVQLADRAAALGVPVPDQPPPLVTDEQRNAIKETIAGLAFICDISDTGQLVDHVIRLIEKERAHGVEAPARTGATP